MSTTPWIVPRSTAAEASASTTASSELRLTSALATTRAAWLGAGDRISDAAARAWYATHRQTFDAVDHADVAWAEVSDENAALDLFERAPGLDGPGFLRLVRGRIGVVRSGAGRAISGDPGGSGREDVERGCGLLLGHLAEEAVHEGEETLLVPHVTHDQVDVPSGAVGQGSPRVHREDDAIDHRSEGDTAVRHQAPSPGVPADVRHEHVHGEG